MARGRPKKDVNMTQDLNKVEELALASVDLNTLQPDETSSVLAVADEAKDIEPPDRNSPEWTDFFLSHFAAKEMENGKPKVTGLRRVVGLLIGEIMSSKAHTVSAPVFIHDGNSLKVQPAVVEHEIIIRSGGELYYYTDVADASWLNCGGEYGKHPSAVASTRAEARALRKAAKLNICSSEEVEGVPTEETVELLTGGVMKDEQVVFIDNLCRQRNISAWGLINLGGHAFTNIKKVPDDLAKRAIKQASLYNQKPSEIPESLIGYDANWAS